MLVNLENVQGTFSVVSTGADYNRLQNYKITKFLWGVVVKMVKFWSFEREGEGATKIEQVWTRGEGGSKYRALCDNWMTPSIIEGMK